MYYVNSIVVIFESENSKTLWYAMWTTDKQAAALLGASSQKQEEFTAYDVFFTAEIDLQADSPV